MLRKVEIEFFLSRAFFCKSLFFFTCSSYYFSWLLLEGFFWGGFRNVLYFFNESNFSFLDLLDFLLCFSNSSKGVCMTSRNMTKLSSCNSTLKLLGSFWFKPAFLIRYLHVLDTNFWSICMILINSFTLLRPYLSTCSMISGVITSEPLSIRGFLF